MGTMMHSRIRRWPIARCSGSAPADLVRAIEAAKPIEAVFSGID